MSTKSCEQKWQWYIHSSWGIHKKKRIKKLCTPDSKKEGVWVHGHSIYYKKSWRNTDSNFSISEWLKKHYLNSIITGRRSLSQVTNIRKCVEEKSAVPLRLKISNTSRHGCCSCAHSHRKLCVLRMWQISTMVVLFWSLRVSRSLLNFKLPVLGKILSWVVSV